jgi:hypothetical protein
LAALEVERVAVAIVRRFAERRYPQVIPQHAILRVADHIAEDEVLAFIRPSRTFRPAEARRNATDRYVADAQRGE